MIAPPLRLAVLTISLSLCLPMASFAQRPADAPAVAVSDDAYTMPVKVLQDIVDASRPEILSLSPQRNLALVTELPSLPSIEVVSQPELKLAGMRIQPKYFAASRFTYYGSLGLMDVASGERMAISGLPSELNIASMAWSPDQRRLAFSNVDTRSGANGLWIVDVAGRKASRVHGVNLNAVTGSGFDWMPDSKGLLLTLRANDKVMLPEASAPKGPVVQKSEKDAGVRQLRTYQDLLQNEQDATLFEYYLTTQLATVNANGQGLRKIGKPELYLNATVSPGGEYILTEIIERPFSYSVPASSFPRRMAVMNLQGRAVHDIARIPLVEGLPTGNDAVRTGIRSVSWRNDAPATLVWAEAQDGGDPAKDVAVRDVVRTHAAPFNQSPREIAQLSSRYRGVRWGNGSTAILSEYWWKTRQVKEWRLAPDVATASPVLLYEGSSEDRYNNPGTPVMTPNANGRSVLMLTADGESIYRIGQGSSAQGDRPFLDRQHLGSKQTQRLFRSQAPNFEQPIALLDNNATRILVNRESQQMPSNTFVVETGSSESDARTVRQLTKNRDPLPQLSGVTKELIKYKRADGVDLSGNLYLPPGFKPGVDRPLPVLMWAYPAEFKSAAAAGQVTGSPYRFNAISYWGPLPFLARGFAVLDNPSFPIIGEGTSEPNDTYVRQLVQDAQAAVDELARMKVGDPQRMAIGGHSYGAFMTANLLAHSRLFKAGIARSGAYNRSLTPFGFQSEERNYWNAKDVYRDMSPFNFADQIKDNLLLIHGAEDNNSGTFPMQSERMFAAVKGMGGNVRLVMLPHESHGYRARESIMHMLSEEDAWLQRYVRFVDDERD